MKPEELDAEPQPWSHRALLRWNIVRGVIAALLVLSPLVGLIGR